MPDPNNIRAAITGRRLTIYPARHNGWRTKESWMHWHMKISDGVNVILADDCRDLASLHTSATRNVAEFRNLAAAGHEFTPWSVLVDEAAD